MRILRLLPFLLPSCAYAQINYLADDPVWNATSVCANQGGPNGGCISMDHYTYRLGNDTVLDGNTYVQVMRSGTVTLMWQGTGTPQPGCSGTIGYVPYPFGTMRQAGRQLYHWNGNADELLYDFDLQVGQTLPLSATNWNSDITVSALDSVLVGSEWRHRFALENSGTPYLIEGIGSTNGLFEPVSNFFECGYTLDCFGLGTQGYYPEPGPACFGAIGIAEVKDVPTWTIAPNPTSGTLTITGISLPNTIRIFNALGAEVLHVRATSRTQMIDLGALPNGVHLLIAGEHAQRVVVMH